MTRGVDCRLHHGQTRAGIAPRAQVDPRAWCKVLAHRVRPGAEVLSVGCGPGVILSAVTNLDLRFRATGIDVSEVRLKQAKEKEIGELRAQFVCGDAQ